MPLEPSPAVLRAADVLEQLAGQPGRSFSVAELAREIDIPRATCHTVLLALLSRGYVRRDHELRFTLGPSCVVVGDAAQQADTALAAAAEHAELLARELSAFAVVSIRDGDETRVAKVFDHGPALSLRARVGEAIPLVPPFGASLVAFDPDAIEPWLDRAQPALSAEARERYRTALATIRRRGYSVSLVTARQPLLIQALERHVAHRKGEQERRERDDLAREMAFSEYLPSDLDDGAPVQIAQVSAPVFGLDGGVAAAIMVLGPTYELAPEHVVALGEQVAAAAARATAQAGAA